MLYRVEHSDGIETEVLRNVDKATATRLVEHELSAGRTAAMTPEPDPFEGLDIKPTNVLAGRNSYR